MASLINTFIRQRSTRLTRLGTSHTFSSSALLRNEPSQTVPTFEPVIGVLHSASDKQPPKKQPPQKLFGNQLRSKEYAPTQRSNSSGQLYPKVLSGARYVSPHHFSFKEHTRPPKTVKKYAVGPSAKESKRHDAFYQMGIDPLHESMNSILMSHFVTELGKIKGRAETKLTWRSQRRLGKAIRRAKMMGIIPTFAKRILTFRTGMGNASFIDNME